MASNSAIKDLIHNNLTIPTLPEVVGRITALIEDPETGTAEIGSVIAEDAPMAAKVLRIANSAYYGLAAECVSTDQASTVLGVRVLKNIVTQVAVIGQFEHLSGNPAFDVQDLWRHAVHAAQVCAFLAKRSTTVRELTPDELYVCGLLHDVGKVVMLDCIGQEYVDVAVMARSVRQPFHVLEKRAFGFDHTDVGALVAGRWGLPQAISEAIQYHHARDIVEAGNPVVLTVARVNELVHCLQDGNPAAASAVLAGDTAVALGLTGDDVEAVLEFAQEGVGCEI